jgi:hypothetical protein
MFLLCSMPAQPHPTTQTKPASLPDSVLQAGLAELFQLGLAVARVSARLAEVEGRAVEALAEAAEETTRRALAMPTSLADAFDAGHNADISEAAREAIAARIASITQSFDQAARAVRRTAALQARLAEGRPMGAQQPGRVGHAGSGGSARPPANDAERADRRDDPEWGDEIAGRSDEEVVRDICRDLAPACDGLGQGETGVSPALQEAIRALRGRAARIVVPGAGPRIMQATSEPPDPRTMLPEPDT